MKLYNKPATFLTAMTLFIFVEGDSNFTSEQLGSASGLLVRLNAQQDEYLVVNSDAAGFRVRANL